MLIAFAGCDGAGKTTVAAKLVEFIKSRGVDVVASKEPTNSKFGRKIRYAFDKGERLGPTKEAELFMKDREIHVKDFIDPALEANQTVVLDRYYYCTAAYQGALGMDPEKIIADNEVFAPRPDLVLYLDVSGKKSIERTADRDTVEPKGQEKIRGVYQKMAMCRRGYMAIIPTDDRSIEEVADMCCRLYLEHA